MIPAAGEARRLAGHIAGSKEVLRLGRDGAPVCLHLLGAMKRAGIERALWVVRRGKDDIQATLGDGRGYESPLLEYLEIEGSASVPETLSYGIERIGDRPVALGFPDVLAEPDTALAEVVGRFRRGDAAVVLGLFPTDRPDKADMVRLDAAGRLVDVFHKPGPGTGLAFTWLLAVWTLAFSRRLARFIAGGEGPRGREPQVSDVLVAALGEDARIETVSFPAGSHLDVGTPEDLARAGGASGPRRRSN